VKSESFYLLRARVDSPILRIPALTSDILECLKEMLQNTLEIHASTPFSGRFFYVTPQFLSSFWHSLEMLRCILLCSIIFRFTYWYLLRLLFVICHIPFGPTPSSLSQVRCGSKMIAGVELSAPGSEGVPAGEDSVHFVWSDS
jgi:hypothetical protein